MFRRIDDINTAGDGGNGPGGQGARMRGGIDPAGEARHDDKARFAELAGYFPGEPAAMGRGVPGPDDSDRRRRQHRGISFYEQYRRRVGDCRQGFRIIRFAQGDHAAVVTAKCRQFGGGAIRVGDGEFAASAAAPGQFRQGIQGVAGGPEAIQELREQARAHIRGPDQAEPVDPFRVAQGFEDTLHPATMGGVGRRVKTYAIA